MTVIRASDWASTSMPASGEVPGRGSRRRTPAATATAASPFAIAAAATGRSTASSTSSATSATSTAHGHDAWSTTPTAAPTSRWSSIPTASAATSSLRSASPAGDVDRRRRRAPTSSRATLCLWRTSPWVPLSTTSSCTRARARSSSAPRATPRSSWRKEGDSRDRPSALRRNAQDPHELLRPPSARSATSTTPTSRSARPAVSATWAGVRPSAARS